jgi:hypothetical protein
MYKSLRKLTREGKKNRKSQRERDITRVGEEGGEKERLQVRNGGHVAFYR